MGNAGPLPPAEDATEEQAVTTEHYDTAPLESTPISIFKSRCSTPDNCHLCGGRICEGDIEFIAEGTKYDGTPHEMISCKSCSHKLKESFPCN